jgi:Spy/CpxP family protein refolding chaperone
MLTKTRLAVLSGTVALGLGLLGLQGYAWARYHGHDDGGMRGMRAVMRVLRPTLSQAQKDQIKSIFRTNKATLQADHQAAREARNNLVEALLSKGNVNSAISQLESAQSKLLSDRVALAQQIVGVLTPAQLTQAKNFWTQWQTLREQQHEQRKALFQQFVPSGNGSNG